VFSFARIRSTMLVGQTGADCLEDGCDERLRNFCGLLDAKATRGNRFREFSFASQRGGPVDGTLLNIGMHMINPDFNPGDTALLY
jgi:hypothetical protein